MPTLPPPFRRHPVKTKQEREASRPSARERGYTTAWDRASAGHQRSHPLCQYCELEGLTTATALTDHLYPHKGDQAVFWDRRYWVSSCKPCHDGMKQAVELRGTPALDALARRLGLEPRRG